MLSPRPHSRLLASVWEPGPEFRGDPWVGETSMPRRLQSRNPQGALGPTQSLCFQHAARGRAGGRGVLAEPRTARPEGLARSELTGHGERGQEGGLHRLCLRGRRRGWGLLLPRGVFWVFHGNIPVFDALLPPVLKWLPAHTVRRVDQSLPLCGRGQDKQDETVLDGSSAVTQPSAVSRTHPWDGLAWE